MRSILLVNVTLVKLCVTACANQNHVNVNTCNMPGHALTCPSDPLLLELVPSVFARLTSSGSTYEQGSQMQAQSYSKQNSAVLLRQCQSCFPLRVRSVGRRRAFTVSNAASTTTQAVQDDQVELGKTGYPSISPSSTSITAKQRRSKLVCRHVKLSIDLCRHQNKLACCWGMAVGRQELLGI